MPIQAYHQRILCQKTKRFIALLHKLVRLLTSITLENPERANLTKELQKGIESIGEKMDNTIAIES